MKNYPIEDDHPETHERQRFFLKNYNDLGYNYKEGCHSVGHTEVKANTWVDEKPAGSATSSTLIPRPRRCREFHRTCD
jgi:hypothetical protein